MLVTTHRAVSLRGACSHPIPVESGLPTCQPIIVKMAHVFKKVKCQWWSYFSPWFTPSHI